MQKCTFPGCNATFHPETVREPVKGGEPGTTGWQFNEPDDNEEVPAHDHTTEEK